MSFDSFFSGSPSDSGLLNDATPLGEAPPPAVPPGKRSANPSQHNGSSRDGSLPSRSEYLPPPPSTIDAEAPEESLVDVELPTGYLSRLRRLVDGFGR